MKRAIILAAAAFSLAGFTACKQHTKATADCDCPCAKDKNGTTAENGSSADGTSDYNGGASGGGTGKKKNPGSSGNVDPAAGKSVDPAASTEGSRTTGTHSGTGGDGTNGTRVTPANTGTFDKDKLKEKP